MRIYYKPLILCLVLIGASLLSAQEISDPYEILDRYFNAVGGLERLKAEQVSYSEGTLALAGMEGTIKIWSQVPNRNRIEVALGPLNIIQGDNGEHEWTLDQNGKVQIVTNPDEATIKRRRVRQLISEYAYADRESDIFTVNFDGIEKVEDKDCYVVRITNNINVDYFTLYINTKTFLREKTVFGEDVQSRDVFYGDYREVEGLTVPFWTQEVLHATGQPQEVTFTEYRSNPEVDPVIFEPPEQGAKDYQFVKGDRAENIPFKYIGKHIFIPVIVNGRERLWVLDTGASITVLTDTFANELGLEREGDLKGQGAGGTVNASFATLPPFNVQGIQFKEQIVAIIDMRELIRRVGVDIAGILGFDFLSRFVTKIDFANELVSFYEPETFEYTGDGKVLDIHLEQSSFEVATTLDGVHSGSWLFDIGAGTTNLDGRYALREGYADKKGVIGLAHGAGNEFQIKQVKCDSIQFAGYTVYEPIVNFNYGGTDTTFTADRIGGLGNTLFQHFVIYCDYGREQLIVEKGDKFNQPWPLDNSGLQLYWGDDLKQIAVLLVAPDTPAEKAGFLKDDIIKTVNGIDVALFDGINAVRKLLTTDAGTNYEFGISRAGEGKTLKLKLADLYE